MLLSSLATLSYANHTASFSFALSNTEPVEILQVEHSRDGYHLDESTWGPINGNIITRTLNPKTGQLVFQLPTLYYKLANKVERRFDTTV
jgi:hypothetical protein